MKAICGGTSAGDDKDSGTGWLNPNVRVHNADDLFGPKPREFK